MQEDLEVEFQSLFSLLEELKEGMLMKIKQDRASRTYELQVCGGNSPRPLLRHDRARLASCFSPNLLLFQCPFLEIPPSVQTQTPQWCWSHPLFPWSPACTCPGSSPIIALHTCSPS